MITLKTMITSNTKKFKVLVLATSNFHYIHVYYCNNNETKVKSLAMVTPTNDQCHKVTFCLNNFIVKHLQQDVAFPFNIITFWSDGCAIQYFMT